MSFSNPADRPVLSARLSQRAGFTLVELLVVMMIMASMLVMAAGTFRGGMNAASPTEASNLVSSTILAARSQAMTMRSGSRIVIDAEYDANNPERYLRRISIERKEATPGGDTWVPTSNPISLPEFTYFSTVYSGGFDTQNTADGGEKFIFEFDATGRLVAHGSGDARIVFVAGFMDGGELQTPDSMLPKRNGFIVRKAGRVAFFESPDQITPTKS